MILSGILKGLFQCGTLCPHMAYNVVAAWRSGGLPMLATSHLIYYFVALPNEEYPPLCQTACYVPYMPLGINILWFS